MTTENQPESQTAEQVLCDISHLERNATSLDCVVVKITQSCVVVNVNGVDKYITLDSFLSSLSASSTSGEGDNLSGLLLPSNTFFFAQSPTRVNLCCYYTGGVRNIKYFAQDRPSVIPNIIVSHSLVKSGDNWSVHTSRYFSTPLPVSGLPNRFINAAAPEEKIFGMPFTNTYHDNRMCYGGNAMPSTFRGNNLRGLDWYYQYLFETPFNDDLGVGAVSGFSPSTWYDKLARLASEGESFPYKDLRGFVS